MPLLLPSFGINFLTKILVFSIFAMSLDIVLGYTGLPSFGHAAFFGSAAYISAILKINGLDNFILIFFCSTLAAGMLAAMFGYIATRVREVYFILITLALGQMVYAFAWTQRQWTGGDDGITGISRPFLGIPLSLENPNYFYLFIFIIFIICFILMKKIVNSPFGLVIQGIRENEARMRALGYNIWLYKYISFIIGGIFGGISGILYAWFNGFVGPDDVHLLTSANGLFMVIMGGAGTLVGPIIGSGIILALNYFVSIYTIHWTLVVGVLIVIIVMFTPSGVVFYIKKLFETLEKKYGSVKN